MTDPFRDLAARNMTTSKVYYKDDPQDPIKMYQQGYKDRLEFVYAQVGPQHLGTGSSTNNRVKNFCREMSPYMGPQGDDAGHVVAKRYGGTGRETHNIVPLNRNVNRGYMRTEVEDRIYGAVRAGNTVHVAAAPQYPGPRATRPSSIDFAYGVPGQKVVSGTIKNPTPNQIKSRQRK